MACVARRLAAKKLRSSVAERLSVVVVVIVLSASCWPPLKRKVELIVTTSSKPLAESKCAAPEQGTELGCKKGKLDRSVR